MQASGDVCAYEQFVMKKKKKKQDRPAGGWEKRGPEPQAAQAPSQGPPQAPGTGLLPWDI